MEELVAFYPDIIGRMERVFTSHTFILALAQEHQSEYIQALNQYVNNEAPFRTLHIQLSKGLGRFHELVEYIEEVESEDIFRNRGSCASWRRLQD